MTTINSGGCGERRISFRQAADDLLSRLITFAMGSVETAEEKLVLTVPVESFDHYVDWLQGLPRLFLTGTSGYLTRQPRVSWAIKTASGTETSTVSLILAEARLIYPS